MLKDLFKDIHPTRKTNLSSLSTAKPDPLDAEINKQKSSRTHPWCALKTPYLQRRVYTVSRSSQGTWVTPAYSGAQRTSHYNRETERETVRRVHLRCVKACGNTVEVLLA